ncbi:MAG: tyrosine-type recombinase/integrase, partial [Campylobacteraceae bacterium]|nr:tyrosine-type recombinase/integrase [Campylobacteraceae bacterium]
MSEQTTKLIKSKKFTGVYHSILSNSDKSYYIIYKLQGKTHRVFIGKESEGINEAFCYQKRNEAINKARFGDDTPIIKYKKKIGITFKEAVEKSIQGKNLKDKVSKSYTAIDDIFGNSTLDDITPETIDKLTNELRRKGRAEQTILNYLERIGAVFSFAIKRKLFKGANPVKDITKPKVDNQRERYLKDDEVRLLKQTLKDKPMLLLFVELSLATGARLETITGITKKDINLSAKTIHLKNHKTNKTYAGYIDDTGSLLPLLTKRYKELKNPNDLLLDTLSRATNSQEDFTRSTKCVSRSVSKSLKPILDRLFNQGLDKKDSKNRVVIHTLRHTFASH